MFVIKNSKTNKFVAIDASSGGYPYETEIQDAKFWTSLEQASNYRTVIYKLAQQPEIEIHAVRFETEKVG